MSKSERQWAEIVVLGAETSCPRDECHRDCPLKDLIDVGLSERIDRMEAMTDDELYQLACYHDNCSAFGIR